MVESDEASLRSPYLSFRRAPVLVGVAVEVLEPAGVEARRPANDAPDLVALLKQAAPRGTNRPAR